MVKGLLSITETQNQPKNIKGVVSSDEQAWDRGTNSYATIQSKKYILEDADFFVNTIDRFLMEYVTRLKKKVEKEELVTLGDTDWWCMHPQIIAERARIIAEFVSEEMSGPNPDSSCNAQYKIMHLNEIKYHLATNIIPLGFIRMGDYLERAVLFKVLADRIGFPCALVRGTRGKAWIEIAIPVINMEDITNGMSKSSSRSNALKEEEEEEAEGEGKTENGTINESNSSNQCWGQEEGFYFPTLRMECFKPFPKYFLKPNAVVDLVISPGRILKINSVEAKEYCGYFNY